MKILKFLLAFFLLIFGVKDAFSQIDGNSIGEKAQQITETDVPADTLYLPIYEYSYIQDGVYYPLCINKIQKIKNGHVVRCNVYTEGKNLPVWLVVGNNNLKYNGKRLRRHTIYNLSFKKYHQIPLGYGAPTSTTWIGDYYEEILDILLGNEIVSVKETDFTKCFLVSLDLGWKEKQWNDSIAFRKEAAFEQMKDSILPTLRDFLHEFSFSKKWDNANNILDVKQIDHCFSQWSHNSMFLVIDPRRHPDEQHFFKRKYDWGRLCFEEKISACQDSRHLPAIVDENDERIEISDLRLLYMSSDRITVRVNWTILQGEPHTLVLSLQREKGKWKITGVARRTWHNE